MQLLIVCPSFFFTVQSLFFAILDFRIEPVISSFSPFSFFFLVIFSSVCCQSPYRPNKLHNNHQQPPRSWSPCNSLYPYISPHERRNSGHRGHSEDSGRGTSAVYSKFIQTIDLHLASDPARQTSGREVGEMVVRVIYAKTSKECRQSTMNGVCYEKCDPEQEDEDKGPKYTVESTPCGGLKRRTAKKRP